MTSLFESRLRDGLRELAQAPPPLALSDRALAGARRIRRRRRSLVALAAVAVVGIGTATPLLLTTQGGSAPAGTGATQTVRPPIECRTATNEAVPPGGAVPDSWPSFVSIVMAHLPARDDYRLSSAVGICEQPGSGRSGRMVMSIGAGDEHGQFVVELIGDVHAWLTAPNALASFDPSTAFTCPALRAEYAEVYVCEDATDARPLAFAGVDRRGDMYVFAYYADGRWIILENDDSILELETMLAIVADPELAALLP